MTAKVTAKPVVARPKYTIELAEDEAQSLVGVLNLFRFPAELNTGMFGLKNAVNDALRANGVTPSVFRTRTMASGRFELRK